MSAPSFLGARYPGISAFTRVGARYAVPHVTISHKERDLVHAGYEAVLNFSSAETIQREHEARTGENRTEDTSR